jgi:hypothetical protein
MTETPKAVTRDELAAFYRRSSNSGDRHDNAYVSAVAAAADELADRILADALAHREPEYEPGKIYEDARGDAYCRLIPGAPGNGQWAWTNCRTDLRVGEEIPDRPLRKLVPEGLPRNEWSYYEVRDTIVAGLDMGHSTEQIASDICKLLDGTS